MVTFTLSQIAWQYAKLRAILAVSVSVVCLPTCQTAWQFFILSCQRDKRRAKFSNISLTNAKGNFYTLLLYNTRYHSHTYDIYIILDIIVIHMISICLVLKNCIILQFYTSCHIKEKCAGFLFFENVVL